MASLLDQISITPYIWYAAMDLVSDFLYISFSKDDEVGVASSWQASFFRVFSHLPSGRFVTLYGICHRRDSVLFSLE